MCDSSGLRARKKLRTRRTLVDTGLRLFDRDGYEQTNVTRIAAAADVSRATFFNYFATKEDLVFADTPGLHSALLREVLAHRRPGEPVRAVLMSAVRHMLDSDAWSLPPNDELTEVRARLLTTVPALRVAAQSRLAGLQHDWTELVAEEFAPELSRTDAAAIVGALTGAVTAAAFANLDDGHPVEPMAGVVERAARIALFGDRAAPERGAT